MTVQEFIDKYKDGVWDFDKAYGPQCVDLAQFYNRDVVGGPVFTGNAVNIFDQPGDKYIQISNTPTFVPQAGDIVVFDRRYGNGFGHVSVCTGNGNIDWFESLDENWEYAKAHVVRHNYVGLRGFLRPKKFVAQPTPLPPAPGPKKFVTVTLPNLQVRSAPTTEAPGNKANTPDGILHAGMVVEVASQGQGQRVTIAGVTTDIWYKSVRGNWFWSGGTK